MTKSNLNNALNPRKLAQWGFLGSVFFSDQRYAQIIDKVKKKESKWGFSLLYLYTKLKKLHTQRRKKLEIHIYKLRNLINGIKSPAREVLC